MVVFAGNGGTGSALLDQQLGATSGGAAASASDGGIGSAVAAAASNAAGTKLQYAVWPSWVNPANVQLVNPSLGEVTNKSTLVYLGSHGLDAPSTIGSSEGNLFGEKNFGKQGPGFGPASHSIDGVSSLAAAYQQPATWDSSQVVDAIKAMQEAGFKVTGYDSMMKVWKNLVQRAGDAYTSSQGQQKVTPWDVLSLYASENSTLNASANANATKTQTSVSRSVSDIDQGQAWQTLQGTLSNMLGRDPSDNELRDFVHRMNRLAVQNPSVTTTKTTATAAGNTSSSSHTDPGFTSSDMAQEAYDNAQQSPDYGAYQAGSTYFNAVMSALGAIGNVGAS